MNWTTSPPSPFPHERNPLVIVGTRFVRGIRHVYLGLGPGRLESADPAAVRELAAKLVEAADEIDVAAPPPRPSA